MTEDEADGSTQTDARQICGLVLPLSATDGCSEQHWLDVRSILTESVKDAGLEPNLVSDADDVGIIQKRIVQNLYTNPVVICDVSGKNPNVMFELGLRLAFDKPTIIVKDDKTSYSFDTAPIEHLAYPRDLRFNKIVGFKRELTEKIRGTVEKAQKDPQYTTFLRNFGKFTVATLETTPVSKEDFILEQLEEVRGQLGRLSRGILPRHEQGTGDRRRPLVHELDPDECGRLLSVAAGLVVERLIDGGETLDDLLGDPERAVDLWKEYALRFLPYCFSFDNGSCRVRLLNAFVENVKQRASAPTPGLDVTRAKVAKASRATQTG